MTSATQRCQQFRNRAVRLLETFFAIRAPAERQAILNEAFGDCDPNPAHRIDTAHAVDAFAAEAVDKLLEYGPVGRGRHALSLLLTTMASKHGREAHPDYHDIPRALDECCALPTRAEVTQYLKRLIDEIELKARRYSPLSGIAAIRPAARVHTLFQDDPLIEQLIRHQSRASEMRETAPDREYGDILEAFHDVKRAALLGAPGSGKSTTLRRLAVDLAKRALSDGGAKVPLLIDLGKWTGAGTLAEFVSQQAPEIGWATEALCQANQLVLLLDGLNEVPSATRALKAADIRKYCGRLEKLNRQVAIVGSCRREDYTGELDLGFDTLTLEPLTPWRVRAAIRHWVVEAGKPAELGDSIFWQLAGDERLGGVFAKWVGADVSEESFWNAATPNDEPKAYGVTTSEDDQRWSDHIPNRKNLVRLAENPLMLTMLFAVRWHHGDLPKNRAELFGRFISTLLGREGMKAGDPECEQMVAGLADLAWRMQTDIAAECDSQDAGFGVLTVVSRELAVAALGSEARLKKAQDSTLLEGSADIRFRHQLLQEYFTAQALRLRWKDVRAEEFWPASHWWRRSGWEETAVLLAGLYADDCSDVIRWLADAQPVSAAECYLDSGAEIPGKQELGRELQARWLPRLTDIEREPAPEGRAAIGRALGRLGLDNRKGVGLRPDGIPDIDWVEIPGGEFIYQKGPKSEKTFLMSRYPVTCGQFQAFVDGKDRDPREGYANDQWWRGLSNPDRNLQPSRWNISNHPRERVSWFEAMAFCAWLGHHLRNDERLRDRELRLPTEWEWERAARGCDGREYPWGNGYVSGYANINETYEMVGPHYLARTSAVGIYTDGASDEGVLDLAGNVWEWCLNEWGMPERVHASGNKSRVLRGGSWHYNQVSARAGFRGYDHPDYRLNDIGFRVVVAAPIGKR